MDYPQQKLKVLNFRGTGIIKMLACGLRVFYESLQGIIERRVATRRGSEKVDALTAYRDWINPKKYKPDAGMLSVNGLFLCLKLTVRFSCLKQQECVT